MTTKLRYLLTILFLTIIGIGGMNASEKIVTFTPGTDIGETSVTKDNVTAEMTTMNNASYYQIYANSSGTFSCTTGKITKIEFVCTASGTSKYGPGNSSANVGTYNYSGNTGTWTGEATSVTISSTAQVRMSSLSITYTVSDGPINPNVSFEKEAIEFVLGKSTTITNPISKPDDLPVTYVSSKTDVATVDASTGAVTGVAVGDATITASWDAISGKYNNGYAQYAVNVREATAQELALLYESWSKSSATSDGTSELYVTSSNLDYNNWDVFSKVYQGGGQCGKLGTGSAVGSMKTKKIALNGNGVLTFKIKKYSSDTGKLKVTVTGATINGESDFLPESSESWTECTVYLSGGNGSVVITLATTANRMYIDDIMLEEAPATTLEASDLTLISAPVALSFDLFDNLASQTINYTTSSTGAITVSESEYVTTTVDANNKRITVTPIKKTPSEQTITITQAADETYDAGSVSFTVTIDDSTPYVQPTNIEITPNYTFWGKTAQFSGSDNDELSGSLDNVSLAWSRGNGSTYANQNAMRFYKDNTLTFTAPEGYEIKSIELTVSGTYSDLSFSPAGYNTETTTWTGSSQTVTMSRPSDASSYATISKFTITIGLPPAVATPAFSIPDGTYLQGQPFTVTCATEDATLVYTGNGTDPTPTNGGVIKNGITLTANVTSTLKVIACKGDDVSEIASLNMTVIHSTGRGAETNPYTVADILNGFDKNASFPTPVYVKGIISEIKSIDVNKYKSAQYYISDDGTTNNQFYVYNGYYLNGENFTENNQIQVGDVVVVYGYLTTYGTTNEFAQDNKLVSLKRAPAAPTFSVADGTTVEAGTMVTITAEEGAEIKYALNGGEKQTYSQPLTINETTTITAVAVKDGLESDEVSVTYTVNIPEVEPSIPAPITEGFYTIKNNGNGKYVNVAGRRTVTFVDDTDAEAGTVIKVKADENGQVQILRSQGVDIPGYAERAMQYVPKIVQLVVEKLNNLDPDQQIMGENGMQALLNAFNAGFDYHLYTEQAEGGIRIYGKTPSMQSVVDFYADPANTANVDAKLPMLQGLINKAIDKVLGMTHGSGASILQHISLANIWTLMGSPSEVAQPSDDDTDSQKTFLQWVLGDKTRVWDFAYQTAMIYWRPLVNHHMVQEKLSELGDLAQYVEKLEYIRPEVKYYLVADGTKLDVFSQDNVKVTNGDAALWTLEGRDKFQVTFNEENELKDKYYTTLYTDFAYTLPEGVKAMTVAKVAELNGKNIAITETIKGAVPAQTPVLLESETAGDVELTLDVTDGIAIENQLKGNDWLVNELTITAPQVDKLFGIVHDVLVTENMESLYDRYVSDYEYLKKRNAGTVNNKYFFGLSGDDIAEATMNVCQFTKDGQDLAFCHNLEQSAANKAFLPGDKDPVYLSFIGDVDRDGDVDKDDLSALIKIILGTAAEEDNYDYDAANVNGDENENPDIADVTALVNILSE